MERRLAVIPLIMGVEGTHAGQAGKAQSRVGWGSFWGTWIGRAETPTEASEGYARRKAYYTTNLVIIKVEWRMLTDQSVWLLEVSPVDILQLRWCLPSTGLDRGRNQP